jgi:hypothetical protein
MPFKRSKSRFGSTGDGAELKRIPSTVRFGLQGSPNTPVALTEGDEGPPSSGAVAPFPLVHPPAQTTRAC